MSADEFAQVDFARADVRTSLAKAYAAILAWSAASNAISEGQCLQRLEDVPKKSQRARRTSKNRVQPAGALYQQERMF